MARIAIAGFVHETNTFAPMPTPYSEFTTPAGSSPGFLRGESIVQRLRGRRVNDATCGFVAAAEKKGHVLVPIAACSAEPAGQVTANAFESIMGVIAAGLVDQGPFDGVFVELHGAMVYEGSHHGEEEILRRVRAIVGDIPIVAPLDLHGNITRLAVDRSDVLVGYRTYPHTDSFETGERCAAAMDYLLAGKPVFKAFRQVPYLFPIHTQSTNTEPARSIYAQIAEVERMPSVISGTIMEGFPPADVRDMGPSIFTYGSTQQAADAAADHLYQYIMAREGQFVPHLLSADDAVVKAMELERTPVKPVVLADVQDNAGGGATSDTPWVLEALVRHGAQGAALGLMFDPAAAAAAHSAGEGADVELGLGGRLMPGQKPFRGTFRVEKLAQGPFQGTGPIMKGMQVDLGKMAQLRIGGVRVAVASVRTQMLDQSYFRQVGIDPPKMKIVVVKSSNHYRADFQPISSAIYSVEAPGAITEDPAKAVYHHLRDGVRLRPLGPAHKAR